MHTPIRPHNFFPSDQPQGTQIPRVFIHITLSALIHCIPFSFNSLFCFLFASSVLSFTSLARLATTAPSSASLDSRSSTKLRFSARTFGGKRNGDRCRWPALRRSLAMAGVKGIAGDGRRLGERGTAMRKHPPPRSGKTNAATCARWRLLPLAPSERRRIYVPELRLSPEAWRHLLPFKPPPYQTEP